MEMFKNKTLKYTLLGVLALIIFTLIGKKIGWIGSEKPLEVYVEKAIKRTIYETITANGKIEPVINVKVSSDVSGEIIELYVKEGQKVDEGQLLLKIKPTTYISARDRAQAALDNAKVNLDNANARFEQAKVQFEKIKLTYDRNKVLWENRTISQSEWENVESEYKLAQMDLQVAKENVRAAQFGVKSAEASLAEANENLRKTSIYAPMSGVITKLNVKKGERVVGTEMMAGTELLHIADLNKMQVVVTVNENDIIRVKVGDTAIVEVDAFLGKKFKGIVTDIAHSASISGQLADQVTTFEVKIELIPSSYIYLSTRENPYPLRPGMSSNVDIQTQVRKGVVSIPLSALTSRSRKSDSIANNEIADSLSLIVFLVKNNHAILQPVTTGIQDENFIEIVKGVKEGDEVIVGPFLAVSKHLHNNMPVQIVDKKTFIRE
ncbi:MAG: efflux RND transporter periplasmic adaptor subunit [Bacteroidales bacterium]|nr:efflux RND transporter periplasmic adaptor subunit [Bacteroidales bacterium]